MTWDKVATVEARGQVFTADQLRKRLLHGSSAPLALRRKEQRDANRVTVDFTQAFSSPGYSDRVVKRLVLKRLGGQWKITEERVLSVL